MISRLARVTLFLLTFIAGASLAQTHSVSLVTHSNVSTSELTSAQLRKIFSMRQTVWPDGTPIVVFVLASQNPTHQALCKEILKMFPYQVERYWNKLAYSGLGEKPFEVSNEQEMLEKIQQTPGAIGYVLSVSNFENLQKIKVERE